MSYISNGTISIYKGTAPTGLNAVLTTGGSIPVASYNYVVSAIFDNVGESLPSTPVSVTIPNSTNDAVSLTWNAVPGANSYRVYRKTSGASSYSNYITSATNSVMDTNQVQSSGVPQVSDTVSNVVLGTNTTFSTSGVIAGNSFKVRNDPVIYQVASVISDTKLTLSVNYAAAAVLGGLYQVCNYFTPTLGLAEIEVGTADWPHWLTADVIRKLDQKFASGTASGLDVDKVDGFNASQTPVASEIPVLNSSGALRVGDTSPSTATTSNKFEGTSNNGYVLRVLNNDSTNPFAMLLSFPNGASNSTAGFLVCNNQSSAVFKILYNGNVQNTNNSYGALSDINFKENVVTARGYLEDLNSVRVVRYSNKADHLPEPNMLGVIAQEVENIFPSIVDTDEDGVKSVKYSIFVPMLITAIQELSSRLAEVEAKLNN